ncbi:MAG: S1 RNA-binding domain-containing protein [Deltaproteobacteria bacterium]|nr:S1 RNA-binding domain-containing protein [Deltaproteobacteria bacterium]MBW1965457.1 S1 RNA-binding domain-containing protein [Deltaproteobacteria bacterium]
MLKGKIQDITDFGIFIGVEKAIEGFINVSELPEEKGPNSLLLYHVDDVIEAIVIAVSQQDKRFELSVRRLEKENKKSID